MSYTNGLDKPSDYFNTVTYTGDGTLIGSGGQSITGVGFQPDLVWIKDRTTAYNHILTDIVRGATNRLQSDTTNAEASVAEMLSTFDTDGFTVGGNGTVNQNTDNYVSWNWLAGGTASSNTDGSITSQVSASTTSGFSIVSYTGTGANATVGHGLGSEPDAIIFKSRSNAYSWVNYYKLLGTNSVLALNSTNGLDTGIGSSYFNSTSPTSSVFSLGTAANMNGSGLTFVAYCFKNIKGYSKIGTYTGNGSTDGTFVYTGFKPAFVMVKASSISGESWQMLDSVRDIDNPTEARLIANGSNAENINDDHMDIVSNGFKIRWDNSGFNQSGATYIYMTFASNPFVTSTGVPTTAR